VNEHQRRTRCVFEPMGKVKNVICSWHVGLM
jgi:hypothetical protein